MSIVYNKFKDHQPSADAEIIILGLFTSPNKHSGDFFFSRSRIFLWHMLPICFKQPSLQEADVDTKKKFMQRYRIDFLDIINSVDLEDADAIIDDEVLDGQVHEFTNIVERLKQLPQLKSVYFTRKTFNGIPHCKQALQEVVTYCKENNIRFCKLDTPSRHYSQEKQQQWIDTIVLQKTCLRV